MGRKVGLWDPWRRAKWARWAIGTEIKAAPLDCPLVLMKGDGRATLQGPSKGSKHCTPYPKAQGARCASERECVRRAAGWLERQAGRPENGRTFEPGERLGKDGTWKGSHGKGPIHGSIHRGWVRNLWVRCGCATPLLLVAGASQRPRLGWGLLRERERCNLSESRGGSSLVRRGEPLASRRLLEKPSNTLLHTSALDSPVPPQPVPQLVPAAHEGMGHGRRHSAGCSTHESNKTAAKALLHHAPPGNHDARARAGHGCRPLGPCPSFHTCEGRNANDKGAQHKKTNPVRVAEFVLGAACLLRTYYVPSPKNIQITSAEYQLLNKHSIPQLMGPIPSMPSHGDPSQSWGRDRLDCNLYSVPTYSLTAVIGCWPVRARHDAEMQLTQQS